MAIANSRTTLAVVDISHEEALYVTVGEDDVPVEFIEKTAQKLLGSSRLFNLSRTRPRVMVTPFSNPSLWYLCSTTVVFEVFGDTLALVIWV